MKPTRKGNRWSLLLALIQFVLGWRVVWRLLATSGGSRVSACTEAEDAEGVSVLVPVLNEYARLGPCLEGLVQQGAEVVEILVIDGGSCDGTQELVSMYAQRDRRVRLVDASPVPDDWNGKAWGLQVGLQASCAALPWIVTIDADVRPGRLLVRSLLAHARQQRIAAFSLATQQHLTGVGLGLLHPALLTTLVYRTGSPGKVAHKVHAVQANGQCFLLRRALLTVGTDFAATRHSLCEDVTLARMLVAAGHPVGFYETDDLVSVTMYADWRDAWENWTRSLPMRDQLAGPSTLLGWLEIALVQALPLPLCLLFFAGRTRWRSLWYLNVLLLVLRVGMLCGISRVYRQRPWSYWLSPLCDGPVALKLGLTTLRRRHQWRGRVLWRGGKT